MDADIFVSGKKKLRIQKYPDTCGRGLTAHAGQTERRRWLRVGLSDCRTVVQPVEPPFWLLSIFSKTIFSVPCPPEKNKIWLTP